MGNVYFQEHLRGTVDALGPLHNNVEQVELVKRSFTVYIFPRSYIMSMDTHLNKLY